MTELEWDCERRSIRKITRNKLPIDLKEYAQRANAYVLGYHWTLANRKWCKKSYEEDSVWGGMPKTMVSLSVALNPPRKLTDLYYD